MLWPPKRRCALIAGRAAPPAPPAPVTPGTSAYSLAPVLKGSRPVGTLAIGTLASLQSATRLFSPYAWGWLADHSGARTLLLRWAIAGVADGMIRFGFDWFRKPMAYDFGNDGSAGNWIGLAMFVALGMTATGLGQTLQEHRQFLRQLSGVVIALMGVLFIVTLFVPRLNREWRPVPLETGTYREYHGFKGL